MTGQRWIAFGGTLLALACAGVELTMASSNGISGFSGNPSSGGATCNDCHDGGTAPTVVIDGPAVVAPGATHTYTLTISAGQERAGGLGVSVTDGTLAITDPGTYLLDGEVVHSQPRTVGLGTVDVIFSFNWTAPLTAGSATLYGCGNSVNLQSAFFGDRAATDTLSITVGSASTPGEASAPGLDPLRVTAITPAASAISLTYGTACGATDHNIYFGELSAVSTTTWSGAICGIGSTGTYEGFSPGEGSYFFLVVGNRDLDEGSYGQQRAPDGSPSERPAYPGSSCGQIQDLSASCDN